MIWVAITLGVLAAGELWLLLRERSKSAKLRVLNQILKAANETLHENAKIDAAPMDADDASSAAHDLAKRVRKN